MCSEGGFTVRVNKGTRSAETFRTLRTVCLGQVNWRSDLIRVDCVSALRASRGLFWFVLAEQRGASAGLTLRCNSDEMPDLKKGLLQTCFTA